jgi:putative FmdB family regulatory protein
MRVYEYRCDHCGWEDEYRRKVQNCMDTPRCYNCGSATRKVIRTAPKGHVRNRFEAFKSPVDGRVISNAEQLRTHNERNNVVSMADGYSTEQLMRLTGEKRRSPVEKDDVIEAFKAVNAGYTPRREYDDAS